jgi:hypothetical protein
MVGFGGSTQEKSFSGIFRFGYRKAANDKMLPDPVGSGPFLTCLYKREDKGDGIAISFFETTILLVIHSTIFLFSCRSNRGKPSEGDWRCSSLYLLRTSEP